MIIVGRQIKKAKISKGKGLTKKEGWSKLSKQ